MFQEHRDSQHGELAQHLQEARWTVQERAAALLDDPDGRRGDPQAPAALPRVRADGDEAARPARDRHRARPARVDRLARHQQQVHGDAGRRVRAQVLLLARDGDGERRRLLGDRDPRRDQGNDRRREPGRPALRCADRPAARPPGPEGRAPHRHQVPPAAEGGFGGAPAPRRPPASSTRRLPDRAASARPRRAACRLPPSARSCAVATQRGARADRVR